MTGNDTIVPHAPRVVSALSVRMCVGAVVRFPGWPSVRAWLAVPMGQVLEDHYLAKATEAIEGLSKRWCTQSTLSQDDSGSADAAARQTEVDRALSEIREGMPARDSIPFFSMLVLDLSALRHVQPHGGGVAGLGGALEAAVHEVTVWREGMDAQAEYSEGRCYRVAGLVPSADRRDGDYGGGDRSLLRFSNGRSCKWSPVPTPGGAQWAVARLARRRTVLQDLHRRCGDDGVPDACAGRVNGYVDVVVSVLRVVDEQAAAPSVTGRGATGCLSHVFVCDESGGVAVIDVWGGVLALGVPIRPGFVVCIQDLKYVGDVLRCVVVRPWRSVSSYQNRWCHAAERYRGLLCARVSLTVSLDVHVSWQIRGVRPGARPPCVQVE